MTPNQKNESKNKMKNITIITVNYNGFAITCELIDSLIKVGFEGEIIVVDNGSKENEAILLMKQYPIINVLRSEENIGFAAGNNLGIKVAKYNYLFFLNNDTILTKQIWISLIERMESSPLIGMVSPKIFFENSPETIQFAGFTKLHPITLRNKMIGFNTIDEGQYQIAHEIPYSMGAAMLTSKDVIEKVGLIPEYYFLYYEELDWSMRIREAGFTIWYEPKAYLYHKDGASIGSMSVLKQYYMTRNRLFFLTRNTHGINTIVGIAYQLTISLFKTSLIRLYQCRLDLVFATFKGVYHGLLMMIKYKKSLWNN